MKLFLAVMSIGFMLITAFTGRTSGSAEPVPTETPPAVPFTLPEGTIRHVQSIYREGQALGSRPDVFSRVGDSITASNMFLTSIGYGEYDLGDYAYLEPVIAYYSTTSANYRRNSFANASLAAHAGWTASDSLNADNARPRVCQASETPLSCEYRIVRPSVALIMFGSNDVTTVDPADFALTMGQIVELSQSMGVIPVLSTIPSRRRYEEQVSRFNTMIVDTAMHYEVPLMDYYAALVDLPNMGLSNDGVHPSFPPIGRAITTDFRSPNLQYGYNVRNLMALEMLYTLQSVLQNPA